MRESDRSLTLPDAAATQGLGAALADALPTLQDSGFVIHLQGDLGAGKTTCVRGFLRRLGESGIVRSPTYTLVEPYALGELTCVHVDLYRLRHPSELEDLALREYLAPKCVLLIEWPDKGAEAVPPADLELLIDYDGEARRVRLSSHSDAGAGLLERFVAP
jgi:tRNA threonylcarbamoyladenosine biosynthesis protein TsaE